MSAETKAILHRFLEGLFNTGNRAVADACGQWQGRRFSSPGALPGPSAEMG